MLELFFCHSNFSIGRLKVSTHEIFGFVVLGGPVPTTLMIESSINVFLAPKSSG